MLSTFTVTNTNDSGAGIAAPGDHQLQRHPRDPNAIYFDIPGNGVQTIEPLSPLPPLTQPVTIDGTTQPGYEGDLDAYPDRRLAGRSGAPSAST